MPPQNLPSRPLVLTYLPRLQSRQAAYHPLPKICLCLPADHCWGSSIPHSLPSKSCLNFLPFQAPLTSVCVCVCVCVCVFWLRQVLIAAHKLLVAVCEI